MTDTMTDTMKVKPARPDASNPARSEDSCDRAKGSR